MDALLSAQHVLEMFRRASPNGASRTCLARLSNRLTKIVAAACRASRRVEEGRGIETDWSPTRFPSPLIKPDVPVSSIRLSDRLHQLAHGRGPRCTSRSRSTPNFPNTIAFEKPVAPRDDTL